MKAEQVPDGLTASSTLRVVEADPQTDPRWEALMTSISTASIYYHPIWLKLLEKVYGYKPLHLACEDETGRLVGILPLYYQRGWRSGRSFRSHFTGPLVVDDNASALLLKAAAERSQAHGAHMRLKALSNKFDGLVDGMVGVPVYDVFVLALPEQPDLLRLHSTIKRAVNKAIRSGVEVRQAQTEDELCTWYDLYLQTMRKLNALPNPYHYYKEAWRRLHSKGFLRLLLAEQVEEGHRRLLGGILILLYGKYVSFVSVGWREEDQALRPNDLLHWQAIQDVCKEGYRWYDFGDVELGNEGLARYKRKWGAEATTAYDYSVRATDIETSNNDNHSIDRTQKLIQAAWRHLPVKAVGVLSYWYYVLRLN